MKKFVMIISFFAAIFAVIVTYILSQPEFGRTARGERLSRIQQSPQFKNEKFQNEHPTRLFTSKESRWQVARRFLFSKKSERLTPGRKEIPVVKTDLHELPAKGDYYVWFGHSSFLLRLQGKVFLVDPVFYKAAPFSFINRPFHGTDVFKPSDMPDQIDYLIISHDHWDHLSYETVTELHNKVKQVVCPLGIGEDFEYWGYAPEQIIEMDWYESQNEGDNLVIHCLPTQHFTGRGFKNPKTEPASWLIDTGEHKIFYTGDGGYSDRFKRFGEQFPDIDLAIMENGQYDKRWSQIHTLPEQLGQELKELHPKRFLTVHHSKYRMANHQWDEPLKNEKKAAEESQIELIRPIIGQPLRLWD